MAISKVRDEESLNYPAILDSTGPGVRRSGLHLSTSSLSINIKGGAFRMFRRPSLSSTQPSSASYHQSPEFCGIPTGLKVLFHFIRAQSCPTLYDPMTVARHVVHGILQQESSSGLSFPSPGELLNPGVEPVSPALQAASLSIEPHLL